MLLNLEYVGLNIVIAHLTHIVSLLSNMMH